MAALTEPEPDRSCLKMETEKKSIEIKIRILPVFLVHERCDIGRSDIMHEMLPSRFG